MSKRVAVRSDGELIESAIQAYFRREGPDAWEWPYSRSSVRVVDGRRYVVLRGDRGHVLGVWRDRPGESLVRLKRWPKALESATRQ
jgi:hypothetical protein